MSTVANVVVALTGDITGLTSSLNQANKEVDKTQDNNQKASQSVSTAWKAAGAAIGAALATGFGVAGKALLDLTSQVQEVTAHITASTGLVGKAAEEQTAAVKRLYTEGLGESLKEVAGVVAEAKKQLVGLSDESLEQSSGFAMKLSKATGEEASKILATQKTIMEHYKVSAEEAQAIIASGFQDGLNASGDFLDTLNEYAPQFTKAGYSAQEMYSAVATGAQQGVLGTDKAADALKEFSLRALDGAKTTKEMWGQLGYSYSYLEKQVASGKMSMSDLFNLAIQGSKKLKGEAERTNFLTALFGGPGEDLGYKALAQIDTAAVKIKDHTKLVGDLDAQYSTIGSNLEELKRKSQVALEPFGAALASVMQSAMPMVDFLLKGVKAIGDGFNHLSQPIKNAVVVLGGLSVIGASVASAWGFVAPILGKVKVGFTALVPIFNTVKTAVLAMSGPIGIVIAAVSALYLAYKTNFLGLKDFIDPVIKTIGKYIASLVDYIKWVVQNSAVWITAFHKTFSALGSGVKQVVSNIGTILKGLGLIFYGTVIEPLLPVARTFSKVWEGIVNIVRGVVNKVGEFLKPLGSILSAIGVSVGDALQKAAGVVGDTVTGIFQKTTSQMTAELASTRNVMAQNSSATAEGFALVQKGAEGARNATVSTINQIGAAWKQARQDAKPLQLKVETPRIPTGTPSTSTPATGRNPAITNTPRTTGYSGPGADADPEDAKKAAAAAKRAKEEAERRTQAIRDTSKALRRFLEDEKLAIAQGKMTQEMYLQNRRRLEDFTDAAVKAGIATNGTIANLLKQGKALETTSRNAAQAHTKALEAQKAQKEANKLANDRDNLSTNIKRTIEDQKALIKSGKMSQEQLTAYIRKLEDYGKSAKDNHLVNDKTIKGLLAQANGLLGASRATVNATTAEINRKKALEEAQKAADKAAESLVKYVEALKELNTTRAEINSTTEDRTLDAKDSKLNNDYSADKAKAESIENEEERQKALLAVEKKYAPLFEALQVERLRQQQQREREALEAKANEAIEKAREQGLDTTELEKSTQQALAAIDKYYDAEVAKAHTDSVLRVNKAEQDANKAHLDQLKKDKLAYYKGLNEEKEKSLSELSGVNLSDYSIDLDKQIAAVKELGASGADALEYLKGLADKVKDEVKKRGQEALKLAEEVGKRLKDYNKELGNFGKDDNTLDSYLESKLAPITALREKANDDISEINKSLNTLGKDDPSRKPLEAKLTQLQGFLTDSTQLILKYAPKFTIEFNLKVKKDSLEQISNLTNVKLDAGMIGEGDFRKTQEEIVKGWTEIRDSAKEGSEEWITAQGKINSANKAIADSFKNEVQDKLEGLGDLGDVSKLGANRTALEEMANHYKGLGESGKAAYKLIEDALKNLSKTETDHNKELAQGDLDKLKLSDVTQIDTNRAALNKLAEHYNGLGVAGKEAYKLIQEALKELGKTEEQHTKDVAEFQRDIKQKSLDFEAEKANATLSNLKQEQELKLKAASSDADRFRIQLEYIGKIRDAEVEASKKKQTAAVNALEAEKTAAIEKAKLLGQDTTQIEAYYNGKIDLVQDAGAKERAEIVSTSDLAQKELAKTQKLQQIQAISGQIQQGLGLVFQGLEAVGAMSGEVAGQWAEDMSSMVNDVTNIAMAIAKGDWVSAVIQGLTSIFSWLNRNKKALDEINQKTKEYHEQFTYITGDAFRKVSSYTTGFLFWSTTHYKEEINKTAVNIALALEGAIKNGITSGFSKYMESGKYEDFAQSFRDSIKQAVIDALIQGILQSAVIKDKLGPLIEEISLGLSQGLDMTSQIKQLGQATNEVLTALEPGVKQLAGTINSTFSDAATNVTDTLNEGAKKGLESTLSFWDRFKNAVGPVVTPITDLINSTSDSVQAVLDKAQEVIPTLSAEAKKLLEEVKAKIAETAKGISDGFVSGMKSAAQAYLNGDADWQYTLYDGIKSTVANAIIDGVINATIVQGVVGDLINKISEAIITGQDSSQLVAELAGKLGDLSGKLVTALGPLKETLDNVWPKKPVEVPEPSVNSGNVYSVPDKVTEAAKPATVAGSGEQIARTEVTNNVEVRIFVPERMDATQAANHIKKELIKELGKLGAA